MFNSKKKFVGILGGTFDPPHEGHLFISKFAKIKLDISEVWWVVTTTNPLKKNRLNYEKRLKKVKKFLTNQHIKVLEIQDLSKNIYTIDVLEYLFKKFPQKKIFNNKWKSTNILYSLSRASKILKYNTCIVSYSDIIYDKEALKLLKKEKGEIVILNNKNWKKIWKLRFKNPLKDLENFNYKGKYLTKIGGKVKKISSVKGQFAGLFKISPRGWEIISKFNKTHKIDINNLDITSFFSKFLEKNKKIIKVANYNKSWFEIDTLNDFRKYNIYKKGINL